MQVVSLIALAVCARVRPRLCHHHECTELHAWCSLTFVVGVESASSSCSWISVVTVTCGVRSPSLITVEWPEWPLVEHERRQTVRTSDIQCLRFSMATHVDEEVVQAANGAVGRDLNGYDQNTCRLITRERGTHYAGECCWCDKYLQEDDTAGAMRREGIRTALMAGLRSRMSMTEERQIVMQLCREISHHEPELSFHWNLHHDKVQDAVLDARQVS